MRHAPLFFCFFRGGISWVICSYACVCMCMCKEARDGIYSLAPVAYSTSIVGDPSLIADAL